MEKRNIISTYSALDNARQNMGMKKFAKEVLLEENYEKFVKSYKFMFWFQLIGILAGFLIPSFLVIIIFQDMSYVAFGVAFGILWMCIWFPISMLMPHGKIYRKFAKWFRKKHATLSELDIIFYDK